MEDERAGVLENEVERERIFRDEQKSKVARAAGLSTLTGKAVCQGCG